jgi:hypothetical protein
MNSIGNNKFNVHSTKSTPKLSEKEMSDLRAAGKCFHCKEQGHLARNCPQLSTIKLNSNGNRPPGLSSFSVGMELVEADEEPEVHNNLPLGMITTLLDNDLSYRDSVHNTNSGNLMENNLKIPHWRENYPYRDQEGIVA